MSGGRFWLVAVPALWLAAAFQQALAPRWAVSGVPPDFLLATLAGFAAGALRGMLAGANLAAYAVSRTVLGFLLGWVRFAGLVPNAPVAALSAFLGTILAQGLVMLFAHRGPMLPFLAGTLVSAMINGVLAMLLYASLRRLIDPQNER